MPLFSPSAGLTVPLSQLDVLIVDCQATAAAPRGRLLEVGWARCRDAVVSPESCLVKAADDRAIPMAVTRITGITEQLCRAGVPADVASHRLLAAASTFAHQPPPTVAHFARFERPFLESLAGRSPSSFDIVCSHEISRRLLPDLPRCSLRAVAGYFGRAVSTLRRSGDHVDATAFVWRNLVDLLQREGVCTWPELRDWLAAPRQCSRPRRRSWPMPRDVRLSLPSAPGIYRFLRTSGDVVYVGKASSLRDRVNSYFRQQRRVPERMLEMLSQARAVSFEVLPTAFEAALVEADEIKRHRPPYNLALTEESRRVWFASRDLSARGPHHSPRCPLGPFPSEELLEQFAALAHGRRAALGSERWAPAAAVFQAGYAEFITAHGETSTDGRRVPAALLRLGTRLWREGRRDRDEDRDTEPAGERRMREWTPDDVRLALERLVLRAALGRRRARWLTRLVDAAVVWTEPGASEARLLVIENGEIVDRRSAAGDDAPPVPRGRGRSLAARHEGFSVARFDRLRVLTTELKRLAAAGAPVAVRFGTGPALSGARLTVLLGWL